MFFFSAGNQVETVETHTITILFLDKKESKIYIERKSMNLQYLMRYIQKSCTKPPTLLEGILSECVDNIWMFHYEVCLTHKYCIGDLTCEYLWRAKPTSRWYRNSGQKPEGIMLECHRGGPVFAHPTTYCHSLCERENCITMLLSPLINAFQKKNKKNNNN